MNETTSTPSSHWHAAGDKDPHGGHYDQERAKLTLGKMTDDELANAVFLYGNQKPRVDDILAGTAHMPIVYLQAAKERIRWLSRALERELERQTQAPVPSAADVLPKGWRLHREKSGLLQTTVVRTPEDYCAVVSVVDRNPANVLFRLAGVLLDGRELVEGQKDPKTDIG